MASGEGLSKRLGSLSLASLRDEGYEPSAVAALAVLIGTAHAVEPVSALSDLLGKVDLADVSHSAAKFDPAELAALNARTLHQLPYALAAPRLAARGIGGGEDFWNAVRGNLATFKDADRWWIVVGATIDPVIRDDGDFLRAAAEQLPPAPWTTETWPQWTERVKQVSGRKGRALFHPLRLALTGAESGPELKFLLPLIGPERAARRLLGQHA
jgi:glutamyl-tRNA synthetase